MALKLHSRIHAENPLHFLSSSRTLRFKKSRYQCTRFIQTNSRVLSSSTTVLQHRRSTSNVFSRNFNYSLNSYAVPSTNVVRSYSSQQQSDDESSPAVPEDGLPVESSDLDFPITDSLSATVVVPENWPNVPLIVVSRNPVFPKFIKLLEISHPPLIDLIRRKVKLNQPFAGVFLKKDKDNDSQVVNDLSEVYSVGTFVRIHELQDLGNKLRLVVMAHRTIRITGIINGTIVPIKEDTTRKSKRPRNKLRSILHNVPENIQENGIPVEEVSQEPIEQQQPVQSDQKQSVLMVETENVQHDKFRKTEEVEASTQEVIKTKRDIGLQKDDKDAIEEKFRGRLKGKIVPKHAMDVIDEELTKLGFLETHSSEFK